MRECGVRKIGGKGGWGEGVEGDGAGVWECGVRG